MQQAIEAVTVDEAARASVKLVDATRRHQHLPWAPPAARWPCC